MLFDRLEAPTRKLETQEKMVRRFVLEKEVYGMVVLTVTARS